MMAPSPLHATQPIGRRARRRASGPAQVIGSACSWSGCSGHLPQNRIGVALISRNRHRRIAADARSIPARRLAVPMRTARRATSARALTMPPRLPRVLPAMSQAGRGSLDAFLAFEAKNDFAEATGATAPVRRVLALQKAINV